VKNGIELGFNVWIGKILQQNNRGFIDVVWIPVSHSTDEGDWMSPITYKE